MATGGNTILHEGIPLLRDAFVVIVKTEWNDNINSRLTNSAIKIFEAQGISYKTITVPGAIEIPFAINTFAKSQTKKPDAFIAFGTVIRGGTPHFEYVCKSVTEGITALNLSLEMPVIFGILTLDNIAQAMERTGGQEGDKGAEAAITAIKMIHLKRQFSQSSFSEEE